MLNPDVLLMGSNDSNPASDGVYVQCGSELVVQVPDGEPDRADLGILFNAEGQWDVGSGFQYAIGVKNAIQNLGPFFRVVKLEPGATDPCDTTPPSVEKRAYLLPAPDRFGLTGRWYHNWSLDDDYDIEHDLTASGARYAFGNIGGIEGGTHVIRRNRVQATLEAGPWDDEDIFDMDPLFGDFDDPQPFQVSLRTHPELENVPHVADVPDMGDDGPGFMRKHKRVFTGSGQLFELKGDASEVYDTWFYGVPCFRLDVDPNEPNLDPTWEPDDDAHLDNFDHMLVRFWNIQDPSTLQPPSGMNTTLDTELEIIGSDTESAARSLRVIEYQGKVYCFVADFGGRVHAYDVSDLAQVPSVAPTHLDTWIATKSLTDDLTGPVSSLTVDRAQWTAGNESYDELYVYACVNRVGIQVLRFCTVDEMFHEVTLIQTPGYAEEVHLRVDERGQEPVKTLLLADGYGGIRIYEYDF